MLERLVHVEVTGGMLFGSPQGGVLLVDCHDLRCGGIMVVEVVCWAGEGSR